MISKTVLNIFEEFDRIIQILSNDEVNKNQINNIEGDLKLLKLWRQEIESDKQSIFVIGKTSSGKSAFHNFLLDVNDEKEFLFKTSTGIQTGVIQTLQHCYLRENANAEIKIRNNDEFKKLNIPKHLGIEINNQSIIIPLISIDQISFLRDKIMAKAENEVSFNVSKAVDIINIHFPLKYFKGFIIVDTPGLGSSESTTDPTVKEYFQARSHILWFLNTQQRTLSDSIMLLSKEKNLLRSSLKKIKFIGNKIDLLIDDIKENDIEITINELKEELINTLNKALINILKEKSSNDIIFTSFKKPNKKFGSSTTLTEIKELEEKFQIEKKEINLDNIESFAFTLNRVLKELKDKIVADKKGKLSDKIKKLEYQKSILSKEITTIKGKIKYPQEARERSKREIKEIEKKDNLNTHVKYNQYLEDLKKSIDKIGNQFDNMIRANFSDVLLADVKVKITNFRKITDLSLKEKEGLWKKYVNDDELDTKKVSLSEFANEKIAGIDVIVGAIFNSIDTYIINKNSEIDKINNQIIISQKEHNNVENESKSIDEISKKIDRIMYLLVEDVESRISEWSSIDTNESTASIFENFLQLNYLLDEHTVLNTRIKNK
jgi:hypothetical protein